MIVWRGFGWMVIAVVIGVVLGMEALVNAGMGDENYYDNHTWPQYTGIAVMSVIILILGFVFNYVNRVEVMDPDTGEVLERSPSHSLFFIPMEYWAAIVPLIMVWNVSAVADRGEQDFEFLNSPRVNDRYIVDINELFEDTQEQYHYVVMCVTDVAEDQITVAVSQYGYEQKLGAIRAIEDGETHLLAEGYYYPEREAFDRADLVELKKQQIGRAHV